MCIVFVFANTLTAQGSTCDTTPQQLPATSNVASISPASANDGSIVSLSVLGKGLTGYTLLLCPNSPSVTQALPIQGNPDPKKPSKDTALYFDVSFLPGISDTYDVYLINGSGPPYLTKQQFLVGNSDDTSYVGCGLGLARVTTNGNLACSFSPLTYDAARQMFGKGVADRFLVVQLTVRNTNKDLEYLFQDVRLGTAALMQGSIDKRLMRGVAEKTEQFSARAVFFRLTASTATLLTGISGVVDNNLLTSAAALVAGPTQTGLTGSIPDLTKSEIARLDDLGFTTTSTVVPKNSSIPVVAFLSFHPFYSKGAFQRLDKDDLRGFWSSLHVEVAGVHVQQSDLTSPTMKTFLPPTPTPSPHAGTLTADLPFVIQGSGLTSVASVLLQPQSNATPAKANVTAQLQPISGQSLDNNVGQLVIPAGAVLEALVYEIIFVTKDGKQIDTNQKLTVTAAPAGIPNPGATATKPAPPQ